MKNTDYKFRLSLGALCEFENVSGKKFTNIEDVEDVVVLMFIIFRRSNPDLYITDSMFLRLMENEKFTKFIFNSFYAEKDRMFGKLPETTEQSETDDDEPYSINQIVSLLVVDCHVDPDYVMDRMPFWQITPFLEAYNDTLKMKMEWDRIRLFILALPNIDRKKVKEPSDLIPFGWEDTRQERKQKELESMRESLKGLFRKKKKEDSDERGTITNNEQE